MESSSVNPVVLGNDQYSYLIGKPFTTAYGMARQGEHPFVSNMSAFLLASGNNEHLLQDETLSLRNHQV